MPDASRIIPETHYARCVSHNTRDALCQMRLAYAKIPETHMACVSGNKYQRHDARDASHMRLGYVFRCVSHSVFPSSVHLSHPTTTDYLALPSVAYKQISCIRRFKSNIQRQSYAPPRRRSGRSQSYDYNLHASKIQSS
jgi:hypothetical protein